MVLLLALVSAAPLSAPLSGAAVPGAVAAGAPRTVGAMAGASASASVSPHRSAAAGFHGVQLRIGGRLRRRMTGDSWHRGCPVPLSRLRLLKVSHWGFDGRVHRGRLVVHADASREMLTVMRRLFRLHFAIRRMRLVDAYGSDDHRSMNADNTSAFNCREVAGSPGVWSRHAYGRAIDVNPVENPYVSGSHVSPAKGESFADRHPRRKGMIAANGAVVRIFNRSGWGWGGNWTGEMDYQHFSATGS